MSLELDANVDVSLAKLASLGGQQFHVCPLPLRQVLAIADLIPKLRGVTAENMSGEKFDPVIEVVRRGLLKAYPSVTTDDLLDLPISVDELMGAVTVVITQAGGRMADPNAGEAQATGPSTQ